MIGLPYWNFLKNSPFVTLTSVVASDADSADQRPGDWAAVKG